MKRPTARKRNRLQRWLEHLLLLAGLLGIAAWLGSNAISTMWQDWGNWVFDREVRGATGNVRDYLAYVESRAFRNVKTWIGVRVDTGSVAPDHSAAPAAAVFSLPQRLLRQNDLVGRLTIPRLHLRAIIREGVSSATLGMAVGHIPGTALPGEQGNVAVAGHRDTLFRGLRGIRQNDTIQLETLDKRYVYQVTSTEVVTPRNVHVLNADSYSELTLVTCYPFSYIGAAPDRFIVKARQVSSEPEGAEPIAGPQHGGDIRVEATNTETGAKKIYFTVSKNHSRELAPGISIGITDTNASDQRVDGWMWLMSQRRTVWLKEQAARDPVMFYGYRDGRRREVMITSVTRNSATGYMLIAEE